MVLNDMNNKKLDNFLFPYSILKIYYWQENSRLNTQVIITSEKQD